MNKKKKRNLAAEDLIESLMSDLNNDSGQTSSPSIDGHSLFSIENSSGAPDSQTDNEKFARAQSTDIAVGNLWSDLEAGIHPSQNEPVVEVDEYSSGKDEYSSEGSGIFDAPVNFVLPEIPKSEILPSADELAYSGPSAGDGGYQSADEIFSAMPMASSNDGSTNPVGIAIPSHSYGSGEDKTVSIQNDPYKPFTADPGSGNSDQEATLAVEGFANAKLGARRQPDPDVRVSIGQLRGGGSSRTSGSVFTSVDASLMQSENLKIAQQRILELEKESEKLRAENEELASAGEIISVRADEYAIRINALQKEKGEIEDSHQSEVLILKGNLQFRESEMAKARIKIDELETRLKADFKKIRVKERELENRLELVRAEKAALVRSKDEYILEMKRKIDQLQSELDNYRGKVLELNKTIDSNQDQFKRTVRALRLALSNLEVKEENIVPLKKAD